MPKFIKRKVVASREIKSVWSYRMRRLFQTLNEVPWLSLTALGTLLGVSVLFWYFRSIDFFPSDFSALIGLGVGAAASAFGVLCILIAGLFAPSGFYRTHISEIGEAHVEKKREFTDWDLLGLQLGGVGFVFGLTAYAQFRDCGVWLNFYSLTAIATLMVWSITLACILYRQWGQSPVFATSSTAVGIAIGSAAIPVVVLPLMRVFESEYLYASAVFLMLWAMAILANSYVATRWKSFQISVMGGAIVIAMFVLLPLTVRDINLFPEMTANLLGIRDESPVDLRVSEKTCQLIRSAIPEGMTNKNVICAGDDWGKAKAQILSKVGEQWLIEFDAEKTAEPKASTKLRLTIPRGDVQVVREVEEHPFLGKPTACKTTKS